MARQAGFGNSRAASLAASWASKGNISLKGSMSMDKKKKLPGWQKDMAKWCKRPQKPGTPPPEPIESIAEIGPDGTPVVVAPDGTPVVVGVGLYWFA